MPSLTEVAQIILAIAVAALVAFGVLGAVSSWFRRVVVARVVRAIWRMATEEDRQHERQRAGAAARRERLRSAIGVLSEGLSMGLSSYDSAIKIGQAIAELRAEGPLLLDPHLNAVVRFVELGGTDRSWATSAPDLDRLMKPIIEIVRPDLEATD